MVFYTKTLVVAISVFLRSGLFHLWGRSCFCYTLMRLLLQECGPHWVLRHAWGWDREKLSLSTWARSAANVWRGPQIRKRLGDEKCRTPQREARGRRTEPERTVPMDSESQENGKTGVLISNFELFIILWCDCPSSPQTLNQGLLHTYCTASATCAIPQGTEGRGSHKSQNKLTAET